MSEVCLPILALIDLRNILRWQKCATKIFGGLLRELSLVPPIIASGF